VELVEPMGGEALVTCTFGPWELRIEDRSMVPIKQGEQVQFGYDPELAHVFLRADGRRVTPTQ
jgi:hypothetical protein